MNNLHQTSQASIGSANTIDSLRITNMQSPYMTYEEVAKLFRRSVKTIHNWNSRCKLTGKKNHEGFPDPVHRGLFLRNDIEAFGKLQRHD